MDRLVPFLAAAVMFGLWLWWKAGMERGMRVRTLDTALPPEEVRRLFAGTVASWSWHVQDDGNPMVARSSLLTGIARQRIALTVSPAGERTRATVEVRSYEGQWAGIPQSPYTLLWRIDEFLNAVERADATTREVRA